MSRVGSGSCLQLPKGVWHPNALDSHKHRISAHFTKLVNIIVSDHNTQLYRKLNMLSQKRNTVFLFQFFKNVTLNNLKCLVCPSRHTFIKHLIKGKTSTSIVSGQQLLTLLFRCVLGQYCDNTIDINILFQSNNFPKINADLFPDQKEVSTSFLFGQGIQGLFQ